ncbi:acetoin utilization protein AcuC [Falsirhodobacter halotolerans]|uniref:acetoin utilization protein AcuC n=1 Tax=Falsirhodobacter halotolerans TaxID=1146892 RepID=UPI001FD4D849|nr:acetoin utilization protein AcuC [Falsirhodobacter halotolerans]MCJ8139056.1 acetoin utilization protein AcuC [Falsirhodobacter halotolerans]
MHPSFPILIGAEIYRHSSYGRAHPLRVPRVSTVLDLARALDWLPAAQYRTSPRATAQALSAWHDPAYIRALQEAEGRKTPTEVMLQRHHLGTLSNPLFPEMFRRPATGVGGMMLAAELVRDGGVVHVPGGGTHHGMPDRANGFCYLNDCVLGMLALRHFGMQRIAYVDIDAHHCDGVQAGFAGDPDIRLISVHEEGRWPFTGLLEDDAGGNALNLPVPRRFNDTEMRAILQDLILPAVDRFAPDAIVLQCGADAVEEDPLSRLALSNNAHREVALALRDLCPRLIVTGGGGYNPWSVGRCWAGIWAALSGQDVPDRLPPKAEAVLRGLSWGGGARPPPEEGMMTTLLDPPREGQVRSEVRDRIRTLRRSWAF